jgi:hypothetical protein
LKDIFIKKIILAPGLEKIEKNIFLVVELKIFVVRSYDSLKKFNAASFGNKAIGLFAKKFNNFIRKKLKFSGETTKSVSYCVPQANFVEN